MRQQLLIERLVLFGFAYVELIFQDENSVY